MTTDTSDTLFPMSNVPCKFPSIVNTNEALTYENDVTGISYTTDDTDTFLCHFYDLIEPLDSTKFANKNTKQGKREITEYVAKHLIQLSDSDVELWFFKDCRQKDLDKNYRDINNVLKEIKPTLNEFTSLEMADDGTVITTDDKVTFLTNVMTDDFKAILLAFKNFVNYLSFSNNSMLPDLRYFRLHQFNDFIENVYDEELGIVTVKQWNQAKANRLQMVTEGQRKYRTALAAAAPPTPIPIRMSPTAHTTTTAPTAASVSFPTRPHRSLVDEFSKGIRKDFDVISELKSDKKWHEWYDLFITTMTTWNMGNLVNEVMSTDPEVLALYAQQNVLLFSILQSKIQTVMGKSIISKHKETRIGMNALKELREYYTTSVSAQYLLRERRKEITEFQIDTNWNKTYCQFLTLWVKRMQEYQNSCPTAHRFNDSQKKAALEQAIIMDANLEAVTKQDRAQASITANPYDYDQFVQELMNEAQIADKRNAAIAASNNKARKGSRSINQLESYNDEDSDLYYYDGSGIDDDSSDSFYSTVEDDSDFEVNVTKSTSPKRLGSAIKRNPRYTRPISSERKPTNSHNPRTFTPRDSTKQNESKTSTRIPFKNFERLSPEAREFWNKTTKDDRKIILGINHMSIENSDAESTEDQEQDSATLEAFKVSIDLTKNEQRLIPYKKKIVRPVPVKRTSTSKESKLNHLSESWMSTNNTDVTVPSFDEVQKESLSTREVGDIKRVMSTTYAKDPNSLTPYKAREKESINKAEPSTRRSLQAKNSESSTQGSLHEKRLEPTTRRSLKGKILFDGKRSPLPGHTSQLFEHNIPNTLPRRERSKQPATITRAKSTSTLQANSTSIVGRSLISSTSFYKSAARELLADSPTELVRLGIKSSSSSSLSSDSSNDIKSDSPTSVDSEPTYSSIVTSPGYKQGTFRGNPVVVLQKLPTSVESFARHYNEDEYPPLGINMLEGTYNVSLHHSKDKRGALVDRGANGGVAGNDVRIINKSLRTVDINGIDDHEVLNIPIGTVGGVSITNHGPVIVIMNQYAISGKGSTIHSSGQLENYKIHVDDKSMKVGGQQVIRTPEGYMFPIDIVNGLPYVPMRKFTDDEYHDLPHVIWTSDDTWNPTVLDYKISHKPNWSNHMANSTEYTDQSPFDVNGYYKHIEKKYPDITPIETNNRLYAQEVETTNIHAEDRDGDVLLDEVVAPYVIHDHEVENPLRHEFDEVRKVSMTVSFTSRTISKKRYDQLKPLFGYINKESIEKTLSSTTQYGKNLLSGPSIRNTFKSPFPAMNVIRRHEPVATDTVFSDTAAIGTNGIKSAQIFVGRRSLVTDVYGMHNESQFVNTLADNIRKRGAMDKLISDSARVEISARVKDLLRAFVINDWQSEPHFQHQNFAERHYQVMKRMSKVITDSTNANPNEWLLILEWIKCVRNVTALKSLGWRTPLEVLTGQTPDISPYLIMPYRTPVYVKRIEAAYPSQPDEIFGFFVGFADTVGHDCTFRILIPETSSLLFRSRVRLHKDLVNKRALALRDKTFDVEDIETTPDPQEPEEVLIGPDGTENNPLHNRLSPVSQDNTDDDSVSSLPSLIARSANDQDDESTASSTSSTVPDGIHEFSDAGTGSSVPELVSRNNPVRHADSDSPTVASTSSPSVIADDDSAGHGSMPRLFQPNSSYRSNYVSDDDDSTAGESVPDEDEFGYDPDYVFQDDDQDDLSDGVPKIIRFASDSSPQGKLPTINVSDLAGRSYLLPETPDGERFRATIVKVYDEHLQDLAQRPERIKLRLKVNDDEYDELVAYNEVLNFIEDEFAGEDDTWQFKSILAHQGPFTKDDPQYKGTQWNVLIHWENGEKSWQALSVFNGTDGKVTLAEYALKHNMLDTPGWKQFRKLAKRVPRMIRMLNQAKLHSFRTSIKYMFGYRIPRNHAEALRFDHDAGNTKWADAERKEIAEQDDLDVFKNLGRGVTPPPEYKKIIVIMVYAVKHDGRHKARLVAGGHLTEVPAESVYSGVVSLRSVRLIAFLAELNGLQLWASDISNAYLEAYTSEKVYIIANDFFGDRAGDTLIIVKALYGLRTSSKQWLEKCCNILAALKFFPSKADPNVYMRDMGDHYEYIGVYVDDLEIASKDPRSILDALESIYRLILKGSGPMMYHLGCDYYRDSDGVLCQSPTKYIERMVSNFERMFGHKPRPYTSPLEPNDHPELDTTDELNLEDVAKYQSLIGALQWAVSLGRFDICVHVMTMSGFRVAPRAGHLQRVKRIVGYLSKMRHGAIRYRTDCPDFSQLPDNDESWGTTPYGHVQEEVPHDAPPPRGKGVTTTTYIDANLYHDLVTGRAVTGIFHLINKTPGGWSGRKQNTVATSTYSSEYVAARVGTEQIMELRTTLRYLGVTVLDSVMFGDNESVVLSSTVPHSKLNKRHNALSYHRVREAIAARIYRFFHINGADNPSDILSKHWGYQKVWNVLQPLLFYQGDTANLLPAVPDVDSSSVKGEDCK